MTKVRPRSLLQVVLMGFVLVLMPLGGMIWHNTNALTHLSQLTSDEMERAVKDTRRATLLTAQAIDIERTLRRFAVLGDSRSLASYRLQLEGYHRLLAEHRSSLSDPQLYGGLDELLAQFGSLQEGAQAKKAVAGDILDQFNRLSQQLEAGTRSRVDEQMDRVRLASMP